MKNREDKVASLLVFPAYISNPSFPDDENTILAISNSHGSVGICAKFLFVRDDGTVFHYNVTDYNGAAILRSLGKMTLKMSDIDPGKKGYVIVIALSATTLRPIVHEYLSGVAIIKKSDGSRASLPGIGIKCLLAPGAPVGGKIQLDFNNTMYARVRKSGHAVAIQNTVDSGNSNLMVLNALGGDYTATPSSIGSYGGFVIDANTVDYHFESSHSTPHREILQGTYPPTTPPINEIIPSGQAGWILNIISNGFFGMIFEKSTKHTGGINMLEYLDSATPFNQSIYIPSYVGAIGTFSVSSPGSGYIVGDVLGVNGGVYGLVQVSGIDGSGGVTAVTVYGLGKNYTTGIKTTTAGSGSGCEIDILSVLP